MKTTTTRTRIVHADLHPVRGSAPTYQAPQTLCAPADGQTTRAGWQRLYLTTSEPYRVTCTKCVAAAARDESRGA